MNKFALVLLASISASISASSAPALPTSAPSFEFFCKELLQPTPVVTDYTGKFTASFRDAFPEEQMKEIFLAVVEETESCLSHEAYSDSLTSHVVVLRGPKKKDVYLLVGTDEKSGLISSLVFDGIVDESIEIAQWSDLSKAFAQVAPNGKMAATLMTDDASVHLATDETTVFAIGSTFKLYVLAALDLAVREKRAQWTDVLPLRDSWKSPSGGMDDWPSGQNVELLSFAKSMIAISDNTATDHLIHHLGRKPIEAMFSVMGAAHAQRPLMTTIEMFKLKWAIEPKLADQYVLATEDERRAILDSLGSVARDEIGKNGVPGHLPTRISTIEWFATTRENCAAVFWLASEGSAEVREILSINTPFVKPGGHWNYVGYKGGSEPGVVSMTYLLESKSGRRACLSMSWNDEARPVSSYAFYSLMKKTLAFAESQIP
ncbi:MAG: serine hydrolase [Bdellovibrionota bacterium]